MNLMSFGLFKYFFSYIFKSRTRQKLIALSIIGLLISSFSLVVLQGVMGGLQSGLMTRSKTVLGDGYFDLSSYSTEQIKEIHNLLEENSIDYVNELELEVMAKHENYISPLILRGMDFSGFVPRFIKHKDKTGLVIGGELGRNLRAFFGSEISIISPGHTQVLMQEIPRQSTANVSDFYTSELPEVDGIHGWIRIEFLQNLIRKRKINRLRFFNQDMEKIGTLAKLNEIKLVTWEDEHSTLVFALNLETRAMLFIFIGTSLLIGICISSGFMIFYNKVKLDLASFWILGLSRAKALSIIYAFGQFISVFFCLLGVCLGLAFLYLLQSNKFILMPDHFVERNIPVRIEILHLIIGFMVPYTVSSVFTYLTFKTFKKENLSFVGLIRKVGQA